MSCCFLFLVSDTRDANDEIRTERPVVLLLLLALETFERSYEREESMTGSGESEGGQWAENRRVYEMLNVTGEVR